MKCQKCGEELLLPFKCPYCGGCFCAAHRLPESHECAEIDLARAQKKATVVKEQTPAVQGWKPIEYTLTYIPVETKRKFYFSSKEIAHLTVASLVVLGVGLSFGVTRQIGSLSPSLALAIAVLATTSFLAHELAHKFAAQKAGLWAEFRTMSFGLLLTALSIISPFKIISPGAVVISGFTSKKNLGKISVAGPLINIALSITFCLAMLLGPVYSYKLFFLFGFVINAWIAFFNLIPFGMLDGYKIFLWDKKVWALAFAISLLLTAIALIELYGVL